jgi:protein-disulfide isomerase
MDVELLIVRECPHTAAAAQLLRTALDDIGLPDKDFDTTVVVDQGDADRLGFTGSPTFFVDGTDLFTETGHPAGISCRLYRTSDRVGALPDLVDLRRALKRAADRPRTVHR